MLMLVDAPGLWYRAFYALPSSMRSPDGVQINAVRGFCDGLATLLRNHPCQGLVCAVDNDWRPQWRVDLLPSYKAHRVAEDGTEEEPDALGPQITIILEILAALGLATMGADGYEADDVLATLAAGATEEVTVVTGDRDLFQLVDDARRVQVVYIGRGIAKADTYDEAAVLTRFGVAAAQYADFAVLRGDPSDGLPGVKGIGDKTAAKLITEYGDLAGLIGAAADPESALPKRTRTALDGAADYLSASSTVVRTVSDIALPEVATRIPAVPADPDAVSALTKRFGLGGSMDRLTKALWAKP